MPSRLLPPPRPLQQLDPPGKAVSSAILAGTGPGTPALIAGLEAEGVRTRTADHALEALALAEEETPDVILLGEDLDADPSRVVDGLRDVAPEALILFLMSGVSARRAAYIVSLGVDDIVAPPHLASGVLLRTVVSPLLRARARDPRPLMGRHDILLVDRFSRMVMNQEEPAALTAREFELLERLLEARGRVVSREDLLADIWGEEQDSEAVLDATIHRLRRKLETDHSNPRLLVTIRGVGYRLESSRVAISEN